MTLRAHCNRTAVEAPRASAPALEKLPESSSPAPARRQVMVPLAVPPGPRSV